MREGRVLATSRSAIHSFHKDRISQIHLIAGLGVENDAHQGVTVKHRSRVAGDPSQPNLRQVHLIHQELLDELRVLGFDVAPGQLGENITTVDVPLLELPRKTRLHIGSSAIVEVTGLRNPCAQIDKFQQGLRDAVLTHEEGEEQRPKAGVMSIVVASGPVTSGDVICIELPPQPHQPLEKV